jgi:hypothetical protein
MNVRYEITVEVTANGMTGPLKIVEAVKAALMERQWKPGDIELGRVRLAAVHALPPDEPTRG